MFSSHSRNPKEAELHRKLFEGLGSDNGAEFSQHPAAAFTMGVSTEAFSVAGINQLNIQARAALGFSAWVAKMSVSHTGTTHFTTHKAI